VEQIRKHVGKAESGVDSSMQAKPTTPVTSTGQSRVGPVKHDIGHTGAGAYSICGKQKGKMRLG
jgi:hypothetical protein